jgi:tRNA pseudouridine38-40 synthase
MRNISLVVEFDGTTDHGWQCQPNGVTIEETLKGAIEKILDHPVKMFSAGRTDAGVHAFGQVVNFVTEKGIDLASRVRGLNSMLPYDIRVGSPVERDVSFHARYSAKSKTYVYTIHNAPRHSPFLHTVSLAHTVRTRQRHHEQGGAVTRRQTRFCSFKKKKEFYRSCEREILMAGVKRRGSLSM